MRIRATAPARVDLAGGTLDIWPLCHLLDRPAVTVNVAIDLRARAAVEETSSGELCVESVDREEEVRLPAGSLRHDRLGLATRLAAFFGVGGGLDIHLSAAVPHGSGLGGSSALAVALGGALAELRGRPRDDRFLTLLQNVEAQVVRAPTGYQDYVPPLRGGVNAITATPDGLAIEALPGALPLLQESLLVVDSGIEHQSGPTNWQVVRRFLDGDLVAQESLSAIAACAERMRDALDRNDLAAAGRALGDEWNERRTLSSAVTNDRIEGIVSAALDAGALAAKVCGAGGGGCLAVLAAHARDPALRRAIESAGGAILDCRPDAAGLQIDRKP